MQYIYPVSVIHTVTTPCTRAYYVNGTLFATGGGVICQTASTPAGITTAHCFFSFWYFCCCSMTTVQSASWGAGNITWTLAARMIHCCSLFWYSWNFSIAEGKSASLRTSMKTRVLPADCCWSNPLQNPTSAEFLDYEKYSGPSSISISTRLQTGPVI